MAEGWETSKRWADKYTPEITQVMREVAGQIIEVRVATEREDQERATDYVITVSSGDIGCRVREQFYWIKYGDVTFRCSRPSEHSTETEKIKAGCGHWYLYAWTERFDPGKFCAWVFLDLDKLRKHKLLDQPRESIANIDGSSDFISISLAELWKHDCVVKASTTAMDRITT